MRNLHGEYRLMAWLRYGKHWGALQLQLIGMRDEGPVIGIDDFDMYTRNRYAHAVSWLS